MKLMTTCSSCAWNLRLEKGIRISANHPSLFLLVATSQKVFQLTSVPPELEPPLWTSLYNAMSKREPVGVVMNARAFSLSLKVSRIMPNASLLLAESSRFMVVAWIPSGWLS